MKKVTEKQFTVESDGSVTVSRPDAAQMLLYDGGLPGRLALAVMTSPAVSKLSGAWMSSPCSVSMIDGFIRKNGIDMSEYESVPYASFNDFFTRRLLPGQRPVTATRTRSFLRRTRVCPHTSSRRRGVLYQGRAVYREVAAARRCACGEVCRRDMPCVPAGGGRLSPLLLF